MVEDEMVRAALRVLTDGGPNDYAFLSLTFTSLLRNDTACDSYPTA